MTPPGIYLDHAATSFPKPPGVLAAVQEWFTDLGVSAHRGAGSRTAEVARRVDRVRQRLGERVQMPGTRVVFTAGATDSLNIFLDGFLDEGDRYLTTDLEHSSLIRPLHHLGEDRRLHGTILASDGRGRIAPEHFAAALQDGSYRLVAFSHGSNVFGSVQDAAEICRIARAHGCVSLVDASATAGLLDLDFGADAVVASAHKSLLAPPGLGFLAVGDHIPIRITRYGGTGSSTALATQPEDWPTGMESGTPNTPAILGLGAALDFLEQEGEAQILTRELGLIDDLRADLEGRAILYGQDHGPRLPILSFQVPGYDPAEIGLLLDGAGIHVRTGFHCAPHATASLPDADGGTVRVSVGPFNSAADIQALTRALPGSPA